MDFVPGALGMAPMQRYRGTNSARSDVAGREAGRTKHSARPGGPAKARGRLEKINLRQGVNARAVMLHLRSCYVSKAAILTVPVHLVPVENRSPA